MKKIEGDSLKLSMDKLGATRMNPLQLLNNINVKVKEEPINENKLESVLKGELYMGKPMCAVVRFDGLEIRAIIDMGVMAKHVKANLIPRLGLQVARVDINVSFAFNN